MSEDTSALSGWTPEQLALGKRWVAAWKSAGVELERIRREELRSLDTYRTIEKLCYSRAPGQPPQPPRPTSGLVEMQRWFMKARQK